MRRIIVFVSSIIVVIAQAIGVYGQSKPEHVQHQVDAILDNWKTRADASAAIRKLGSSAVKRVGAVAADEGETHVRRWRSIMLLGSLPSNQTISLLGNLAMNAKPIYRCFAIQALAETGSEQAFPILVSQLDNGTPCMTATSTDPAQEIAVRVSDEAVRALEILTGRSFEPNAVFGLHRATEPWKKWWQEQKHRR